MSRVRVTFPDGVGKAGGSPWGKPLAFTADTDTLEDAVYRAVGKKVPYGYYSVKFDLDAGIVLLEDGACGRGTIEPA